MLLVIAVVLSAARILRLEKGFQGDTALLIPPWHDHTVQNAVNMREIRQRSLGKLPLGVQYAMLFDIIHTHCNCCFVQCSKPCTIGSIMGVKRRTVTCVNQCLRVKAEGCNAQRRPRHLMQCNYFPCKSSV